MSSTVMKNRRLAHALKRLTEVGVYNTSDAMLILEIMKSVISTGHEVQIESSEDPLCKYAVTIIK